MSSRSLIFSFRREQIFFPSGTPIVFRGAKYLFHGSADSEIYSTSAHTRLPLPLPLGRPQPFWSCPVCLCDNVAGWCIGGSRAQSNIPDGFFFQVCNGQSECNVVPIFFNSVRFGTQCLLCCYVEKLCVLVLGRRLH